MSLITRSFIYTVLKKHQTNVLGLSKRQRLGNTQCMPWSMMLSSRLFLEDITCLHWVPTFLHSFEHRFWQDPENWDNKGTQRACPPTNINQPLHPGICVQHDHHPCRHPAFRSSLPRHHLSAAGSQTRTDCSPVFIPGGLASDVLPYKHACYIFRWAVWRHLQYVSITRLPTELLFSSLF